ncbi:MAG TPA: YfiR family protein [Longimicrobiales bacterium]|nr:YfiR family protein [Longimicrobiales bacterium]
MSAFPAGRLSRAAGSVPRALLALAALVVLAAAGGAVLPQASAQSPPNREYQIKAAFLFNFGQFVDGFPELQPPDGDVPFVIGVLGEDPFGETLDALVADRRIQEHPVVVERYRTLEEVDTCQVLFVSSSEAERQDEVLRALEGRGVLTVGETPEFADGRGIIEFVVAGNRIRLEINVAAAAREGLTISSRLLRLADVIYTETR